MELYHQNIVQEKEYDADQKMMIIWDVYFRHCDQDFLDHTKEVYSNIIVLFVSVNLTELWRPLEIYLN